MITQNIFWENGMPYIRACMDCETIVFYNDTKCPNCKSINIIDFTVLDYTNQTLEDFEDANN